MRKSAKEAIIGEEFGRYISNLALFMDLGFKSLQYKINIKISGVENIKKLTHPIPMPFFIHSNAKAENSKMKAENLHNCKYFKHHDHLVCAVFVRCFLLHK